MHVVSSCPTCGAPIYGPKELAPGEVPVVTRSCGCVPGVVYPAAPVFVPLPYVIPEPTWQPPTIPFYQGPYGSATTPILGMRVLSDGGRV